LAVSVVVLAAVVVVVVFGAGDALDFGDVIALALGAGDGEFLLAA
jgi:hypothetical protein